jgi:hypothetical protein
MVEMARSWSNHTAGGESRCARLTQQLSRSSTRADPALMRRTLSNAPLPARLLMPIIAPRAFSRHARRVYGTATPPKISA